MVQQLVTLAGALAALILPAGHHAKQHPPQHRKRHHRALGRESYAVASWYEDAGATASGWHAYYGVANKTLPFGARVAFTYDGRSVTATVDDRGPYIAGRTFDLNQNTAQALGMTGAGVVTVGYRIVR